MATAGLLIFSAVLIGVFLVVDRRMDTAVLPASFYGFGPLKWVYLTLGLLVAATKVDLYVPLFGQRLAHLGPIIWPGYSAPRCRWAGRSAGSAAAH